MCYDPEEDENVNLWEYENISITDESVPAGYKVRVIGATVKFTSTTALNFSISSTPFSDQPSR